MKKLSKILTLFLIIGFIVPSYVYGQQSQLQVRNRFEQELRNTDEVINHVRNIISGSGIDKGLELLKLAENIQSRARERGQNGEFAAGITLTLSAREQAKNAGLLNQQANENENLVRRQLEKTEKLLDRIRSNMPANIGQRLESLYNTAVENQRRAREFYHNQQLRPALKLSRQIENSLQRLIEHVKQMNGNPGQLQNQLNRMENRINRIEIILQNCNSKRAEQTVAEVKTRLENVRRQINEGELEALENRLRLMNQQLNSVIEICQGGNFQTERLNQLKIEIERVSNIIRESGNKHAEKLLKTAQKSLRKAENLCQEGDSEACAAHLKAAQVNLRKAKRLAGL